MGQNKYHNIKDFGLQGNEKCDTISKWGKWGGKSINILRYFINDFMRNLTY